jgi:hypothetical protein
MQAKIYQLNHTVDNTNGLKWNKQAYDELCKSKSMIDVEIARTNIETWDRISQRYEVSHHIKYLSKRQEIPGIPKNASNAFYKGVEIFKFIGNISKSDILFDNASLPGDFIRAFLFCGGSNNNWYGNSLLGEGALEDRFGLYEKYKDRWYMSPQIKGCNGDVTQIKGCNGDVTQMSNILYIKNNLIQQPTIYTSDLGFKVSDYFNEEREHFKANVGQCLLGLHVLAIGGRMAIKMFSCLNIETHFLLGLLVSRFSQAYLFKPIASKGDNSECYFIGLGYLGLPPASQLIELENIITNNKMPQSELLNYNSSVTYAACALAQQQSQKIKNNTYWYRRHRCPDLTDDAINYIHTVLC